jgi:hypothetical protein
MFALKLNLSLYKYMLNKTKIYIIVLAVAFLVSLFSTSPTKAESAIVISQIQTNGAGSYTTEQEFIEIFNKSDKTVDLNGWQLRYITSSGSLSTAKNFATVSSVLKIHPGGYIVFAPDSYHPEINEIFKYKTTSFSGLSMDGATVDLLDSLGNIVDRVGYGTNPDILAEQFAAPAPEKAGSIVRKQDDTKVFDSDNNLLDFELLPIGNFRLLNNSPPPDIAQETDTGNSDGSTNSNQSEGDSNQSNSGNDEEGSADNKDINSPPVVISPTLLDLKITELMIDPEFPLVDSADEWIEIYNPNDLEVDISGFRIETGSTGSYKYTFENKTIDPKGFLVVKSLDTPISLSNTAGKVSLFDSGNKLQDTVSYAVVESGLAYAKESSGSWQWTTTPTENSENIITLKIISPTILAKSTVTKTSTKPKTTSTTKPKTTTKTTAAPKVAKSKAAKVTQVKSDQTTKPLIAVSNPIPNSVVAILVVVAIIYSIYEYRYELRNKFSQFRIFARNR